MKSVKFAATIPSAEGMAAANFTLFIFHFYLLVDDFHLLADALFVDAFEDLGDELWSHATEDALHATLVQYLVVA